MGSLGINDHHQGIILGYMKFARFQRQQNLKSIELSFEDEIELKLDEPTYTRDEVKEILSRLHELIAREIETELIISSHTNVLLLNQLFKQAEKWHLNLNADFSEIQNRELLEKVKIIEEDESKGQHSIRLKPISDQSGSIELLRIEIDRLQKENSVLQSDVNGKDVELTDLKENINQLTADVEFKSKELKLLQNQLEEQNNVLAKLKEGDAKSESTDLLGEYEKVLTEQLTAELDQMKQEVLAAQAQLTLAQQELEARFIQTTAYANMKIMITKKNEKIKELREQVTRLLMQRDQTASETAEEAEENEA